MNLLIHYKHSLIPILGSVILYVLFAYFLDRSDFIHLLFLYAGLFYCAWRIILSSKISFKTVTVLGIGFRLLFLIAVPNLSQDFYRFLWDGQLMIQGVNPYLFTPHQFIDGSIKTVSELVISNQNELINGMGPLNASHYSNYPPVNQLFFGIAGLFSKHSILAGVIVLKIIMITADIGILYFGKRILTQLNLPIKNIFWYFLNPFIIIELTGNLHFEGVMLFFVIWAFYLLLKNNWAWAAVLLGVSISVKLLPLLFLPLFFKWFNNSKGIKKYNFQHLVVFYGITIGTALFTFIPFLSTEFISNFAATIGLWFQKFEFNASVYYIIRWVGYQTVGWNIIATAGKILPIISLLAILGFSFFRKNNSMTQLATGILLATSVYFLLSTTVHPWYVTTPLLLSVFTRYKFPIIWSFVVMFSYSAYGTTGFSENLGLVAMEYSIVIVVALWEIFSIKSLPFLKFN